MLPLTAYNPPLVPRGNCEIALYQKLWLTPIWNLGERRRRFIDAWEFTRATRAAGDRDQRNFVPCQKLVARWLRATPDRQYCFAASFSHTHRMCRGQSHPRYHSLLRRKDLR